LLGISSTTIAGLLTIHEAYCRSDKCSYIPRRSPTLLMIVCERCTDGHIAFETAIGCIKV